MAGLYAKLPSKDHFEAAIKYEQAKQASIQLGVQGIFQIASLAAQIAGNLPPTDDKNRQLSDKAKLFVDKWLDEAHIQVDEYILQTAKDREERLRQVTDEVEALAEGEG